MNGAGSSPDGGLLKRLHPSGWAHVPRQLLADERADKYHRALYAAIASYAFFDGRDTWRATVRRERLLEYAGYGRSRNTLASKKKDLVAWGYIRVARSGLNDPSPSYSLNPTGGGFASKRIGDLHGAGFTHIPRALLTNPNVGVNHVVAYLAIAAAFDKDTWEKDTDTWPEVTISLAELRHLMGGVDLRVVRPARDQLAELGFISFIQGGGANATRYKLLSTPKINDVLQAHEVEDHGRTTSAQKVFGTLGGRPRLHKPSYPSDVPPSHKPSYPSDVPPLHKPSYPSDVPPSDSTDRIHLEGKTGYITSATPGTREGQVPGTPEGYVGGTSETRLYREEELQRIQSCWCAQAHTPLIDESEWRILKKAIGKRLASLALVETQHRVYHAGARVDNPCAYARRIGACYADKPKHRDHCDQDLHGDRALGNHQSARIEAQMAAEKEIRAALPNPLSHLTSQVADRLTFPEPDDPELRRLAALKALDAHTEMK